MEIPKPLFGDQDGDGYLIIWGRSDRRSRPFKTTQLEDAADYALAAAEASDVYFGVGLQKNKPENGRGNADGVCAIPGLWCDIDIKGPGHSRSDLPATVDEALSLAKSFPPFPPSMVVHSGGGLHVYWLFKEPWLIATRHDRQQAQRLVRAWEDTLRQRAREMGYHLDSTSDLARVLRVPFTWNHKDPENPMDVLLLNEHCSGKRFNPGDFEPYLLEEEQVVVYPTLAVDSDFEPADAQMIQERCPFIRHCIADAQTLDEPSWYAMLTVAARCQAGSHLAHVWSEAHPGYDRKETDRKLKHAKEAPGPYTCEFIAKRIDGSYCHSCQYHGKVKSPVVLGRQFTDQDIRDGYIEELNRKHAAVMVEGRFLIINEVRDHETGLSRVTFSTPADFSHQYRTAEYVNENETPFQGN